MRCKGRCRAFAAAGVLGLAIVSWVGIVESAGEPDPPAAVSSPVEAPAGPAPGGPATDR